MSRIVAPLADFYRAARIRSIAKAIVCSTVAILLSFFATHESRTNGAHLQLTTGNDALQYAADQPAESKIAKSNSAIRVRKALTEKGWSAAAAKAVSELNADWFETLDRQGDGAAVTRQIIHLGQLADQDDKERVFEFLESHPEIAGLLPPLSSAQRKTVMATLDRDAEDYPVVASLYLRHSSKEEAIALADVLDAHGRLVSKLTRRGVFGVEVPWLTEGSGAGAKIYDRWLADEFESLSRLGDSEDADDRLASFFQFALVQGPHLREKLAKDANFQKSFGASWGKLKRAALNFGSTYELVIDEPAIWNLLAEIGSGEALIRDHGSLPATLMFGDNAYHADLRPIILNALVKGREDATLLTALARFQSNDNFHRLVARPLDATSRRHACAQLLTCKPGGAFDKKLQYFNSLEIGALRRELEPEPDGLLTWTPGYSLYSLGRKFVDGREASSMDWFGAAVDGVSIALPFAKSATVVTRTGKAAVMSQKVSADQAIRFAARGVFKEGAEKLGQNASKQQIGRWAASQMVSEVQKHVRKDLAKRIAFDITTPVQFAFQASGKLGGNRETFRRFTNLEARLFMRKDARVVLSFDLGKAKAGFHETHAAAHGILHFFNSRAESTALEFNTVDKKPLSAQGPRTTPTTRPTDLAAADLRWRQQLAAWWLITLDGDLLNLTAPK